MMDLNYLLKTIFIILNILITISSTILVAFTIYILTSYAFEPVCKHFLLYFFTNSILLPLCIILNLLISCGFICDIKDLLGKKNVLLSLLSLPVYMVNFFIGLYFNYIDNDSNICIEDKSSHTHVLYVGYKLLFSYSISISIIIITSLLFRKYIMNKYKNRIYNSPSLRAQRAIILGEVQRESLEIELLELNKKEETGLAKESPNDSSDEELSNKQIRINIPSIFINSNLRK
jgi:hypothetical protein